MDEEWRAFGDGVYEVSNFGNVRRAVGGSGARAGHILKASLSSSGYLTVALHICGKRKTTYVHRLVACTFIGPAHSGMEVNHKDGIKTNNNAGNLEYTTRAGNAKHAFALGLRATGSNHWTHTKPQHLATGERSGKNTLTNEQVNKIRQLCSQKVNQRDIARQFGICQATVSQIARNKTWRV